MRSNKYKFRISTYEGGGVAIALYQQRSDRPLVIGGIMDLDGLFEPRGYNTPNMTARAFIAKGALYNRMKETRHLSGSLKISDTAIVEIISKCSRASFRYNYTVDTVNNPPPNGGMAFETIILIEHIRKYGKFYGKQEKVFGHRKESSQD